MEQNLTLLCQKTFGGENTITGLRRLTGGANAATWSFDYDQRALVLRQDAAEKNDNGDTSNIGTIGLKAEAELMIKAAEHGIKAPEIYAVTAEDSPLGNAVLMERVGGEALPQKLFKAPQYQEALSGLTTECAQILAKIHTIPLSDIEAQLDIRTPEKALTVLKGLFKDYGKPSAVVAIAISWMDKNCPKPCEPVLLHGDFRMGNLLIDENGITAVLDWELAYIGDPVSDLAYFCAAPWRFGRYEQQAGGVGSIKSLVSAYENVSGQTVESERVLWWRLYASVNWCLICMTMANMWRSHADRELERIVIGTRVSESEVDILLVFDEIYGFTDKLDLDPCTPELEAQKARTKPNELTDAVIEWLSEDVIPTAKGRDNFKARIARNAMRVLKREIEMRPHFQTKRNTRLSKLKIGEDDLIDQLLDGTLSIESNQIRAHLKQTAMEQLSIDQPQYAGFKVALSDWSLS